MKLRIQEKKITLRLEQNEVLQFIEKSRLVQSVKLPGGTLELILEAKDVKEIDLNYAHNTYSFTFPEDQLEAWNGPNKIGYHRSLDEIDLTIEKDLPRRNQSH